LDNASAIRCLLEPFFRPVALRPPGFFRFQGHKGVARAAFAG
jgi:hypothetical protein